MPGREAIGSPEVVCERPLATSGRRGEPVGRGLGPPGPGRGRRQPNRVAGPGWAEPSASDTCSATGARARTAAAAAMRWIRALLKNASLAGAPKYIEHFSKFSPSPLSMKQFLDFGMEWAGDGCPQGPSGAGLE